MLISVRLLAYNLQIKSYLTDAVACSLILTLSFFVHLSNEAAIDGKYLVSLKRHQTTFLQTIKTSNLITVE